MEVNFLIREEHGVARVREPVTIGFPVPKGLLSCIEDLVLFDAGGQVQPRKVEVLARWSDHSVKWALLDFQPSVSARSEAHYQLRDDRGGRAESGPRLKVKRLGHIYNIETGVADFTVNSNMLMPFEQVTVDGLPLLRAPGSECSLQQEEGVRHAPFIRRMWVETEGPLRASLRCEGYFGQRPEEEFMKFLARLTFFAGHSSAQVEFTVWNSRAAAHDGGLWDLGDRGSVLFRECSLSVYPKLGQESSVQWITEPGEATRYVSRRKLEIYQDSSGGENWQSTNHLNRFGKVPIAFRGYRVTLDGHSQSQGNRAVPHVRLTNDDRGVAATLPHFWENFPKAFEVDSHGLHVRLFPCQYGDQHELQGGERKTHEVFFQFRHGQTEWLEWTHHRLVAVVDPTWYETAGVLLHTSPRHKTARLSDCMSRAEALIESAVTGTNTFFDRREVIDEYGWRNFGDLYADHEAVGHKGPLPLVAHYNNQYDGIYGGLVQYARTGNLRWFDLVRDLARHVIDIDLYHTVSDKPAYNGGLFWHTDHYTDAGTASHRTYTKLSPQARASTGYGGGPGCEHNYTTGLLTYYFMTGNQEAREAVISLAEWVIRMDDGGLRRFGFWDSRATGLASETAQPGYHGPGRGAGNSINALIDACVLTGEPRYLVKAEELIRRCVHPADIIDDHNLLDIEYRWSYTIFLQILGKYLYFKEERGEQDSMYVYAKDSLLHYAAWMVCHEVPYQTVLHKVLIPTETWPAQDIRKANVLAMSARYATGELQDQCRVKAAMFFQACITDLLSYPTNTLTRPLVILMTNLHVYAHCLLTEKAAGHVTCPEGNFDPPKRFHPQFYELYRLRGFVQAVVVRMRRLLRN